MIYSPFDLEESADMFKQQRQPMNNNENTDLFDFMNHSGTFNNGPFSVPQLTPDGQQENIFTNSSVLSGHNPEYDMSPLQINSHNATYTPLQHPLQTSGMDDFADEEEFLTPLVSPAMAPTYDMQGSSNSFQFGSNNTENIFSPLTSPALHPSSLAVTDQHALQQKLALIERQQQQLRSMQSQMNTSVNSSNKHHSVSPATSPLFTYTNENRKKMSLHPKISAAQSPQTKLGLSKRVSESSPLALGPINSSIAPATPSLLMKLGAGNGNSAPPTGSSSSAAVDYMPVLPAAILEEEKSKPISNKRRRISQPKFSHSPGLHPELSSPAGLRPLTSPRTLKPLISPSLKPNGHRLSTIEEETARALLTSKSNYENQKEGNGKTLGIDFTTTIQSGIEHRRSAHKAAEQKRRDVLKQSFDSLRTEIIEAIVEEELAENEGDIDETEIRGMREKDVKQMSKVVLLQHSYEHIVRLKSDNKKRDQRMDQMRQEIISLRRKLGMQEVTEQEKENELREKQEESERRKERLKRLQNASIIANNSSGLNNDE
ncbi:hypothetical protein BY458DRAFT_68625 [Sporodiniella umbellata]|nr:hypothetical protein BY458DRAFT_68625 [Sporodiniella umbellata]